MPTTTPPPLTAKTKRTIVQRYTRKKDPMSIRAIADELELTYWRVRAVLVAENVELRNRAGARQKPTPPAQ